MSEDYLQVTTTVDSAEQAGELARLVVDSRLAACAQVLAPITSTYWWKGEMETAEEWLIVMKTTAARLEELIERVRAEHSYETPEILATRVVGGNPAYLRWISESVGG